VRSAGLQPACKAGCPTVPPSHRPTVPPPDRPTVRPRTTEAILPTAHVNGVDLAYELSGSGSRLLLLSGSGMTMDSGRPLLGLFAEGFTVLTFDQRGLGASGPAAEPYGMATCAADTLGLLDTIGWDTARVVGVSFGGMVAQELAVTAPDRIERLALLCTSPGGAGGSSYPLHELEALDPDGRAAIRRTLLDERFDEAWLHAHPGDQAFVDLMDRRDDDDPAAVVGRQAQLEARRGHDVWDRLGVVDCPTLVACGRFDPIAPLANGAAIASRVAGAEFRAYDGGHAFFVQDPTALPEIRTFLATEGP
jgi:3-oxoadipate enol-lactonase